MVTESIQEPVEHDVASAGAVLAAGLVLLALVVGAGVAVAQLVDVLAWFAAG